MKPRTPEPNPAPPRVASRAQRAWLLVGLIVLLASLAMLAAAQLPSVTQRAQFATTPAALRP